LNTNQIEVRQKANNELGVWISNRVAELQAKGLSKEQAWEQYQHKAAEWQREQDELDRAKQRSQAGQALAKKIGANPADLGPVPDASTYQLGAKGLGKDVCPFGLPRSEVKKAYEAVKRGGNYIIDAKSETFFTAENLLVPQQAPGVVPEYFEARIVDHLPTTAISAPSYQFLQHQFSADTGAPGFVAEGTAKPQWEPSAEKVIVTAQKIAGFFNMSHEILQDAPQFESYLINTLFRKIAQVENHAILYGTVSSSLGIQGWSTQSGILTHDSSSDPAGSTNLDSLELAINQLRIQSGVYATPNLIITSPTTWSATRRIKATTNQYIAGDPLHEAVMSAWGVPVITTTAVNDGDAFLVDTSKFGSWLVREGIQTHMGYTGTGFTDNVLSIVAEERVALATVIPSAINYVTNLAVS
jgi:HK97 family phage major capsid protein